MGQFKILQNAGQGDKTWIKCILISQKLKICFKIKEKKQAQY